ncbi:MAG: amino acid ABC transporter ATP-binding protein [Beijerinckiaceae bacterium]|nr:amino acid ABC transporter ATP-binding protein [Beijerinckiaceae bacterium]MCZ8299722.1 amino acid ABC transporter ATP-binding protein [Beijerinckiaceae bacterium]
MPERPLLSAIGIVKRFGTLPVLHGIDFSVQQGEMVFIIGPSGSGKSTFLRCCNRLEEPDSGAMIFDGVDILGKGVEINTVRQRIGMVFQAFNLYPHLPVLGNVTLALRKVARKSKAEAERIGRAALASVGLSDKVDAMPGTLSGGQQQRVAIARALALDPKLVLFDEPTSALDPELVGSVLAVMRDLKQRGMTMVVVSHEMRFAREAADRVVFMEGGRIVEQGPPAQLFEAPREPRTREFLSRMMA